VSRFRKSTDDGDDQMTDEPLASKLSAYTPLTDPRDEPPIDAEIVEDEDTVPPPPTNPLPTGQPLLVTVTQLQGTVSELQQGVRAQLAEIADRLVALEQQSARVATLAAAPPPPAVATTEPAWVRRLESTIEGLGTSAAASTAAAITTMGEQQRADLASVHARLGDIHAAANAAATAPPPPSPAAADPGIADIAQAVAVLCRDLALFTDEIRRGFADVSAGLSHAASSSNDAVIAHLVDIRAALRLLVG
jgi:hypothetical protein